MSSVPSVTSLVGSLPMQTRRESLIRGDQLESENAVGFGENKLGSENCRNRSEKSKIDNEAAEEDSQYCSTTPDKILTQVRQILYQLHG